MTARLRPVPTTGRPGGHPADPTGARTPGVPVGLLTVPARQARLEVLLWAVRHGRPVDPDSLTALLAAKHERTGEALHAYTHHTVRELVWRDVAAWCRRSGLPTPTRVPETLWTVLDWLEATDGFAAGSDPLAALRLPLCDSAGLDQRGRPVTARRTPRGSAARHPSSQPPTGLARRPRHA